MNKINKTMKENKSIRARILALQPGDKIFFVGAHEGTIRCTAYNIGNLSGKRFRVRKNGESIMVYRYE